MATTKTTGAAHPNRHLALLPLAIQFAGLYGMFGVAYQNGYVRSLIDVLTAEHPLLPGSTNPVLLRFFGIPPLDRLLSLAQVMYANFTDGSSPSSSLYALQFGGQLISVSAIIWIEGARVGNQKVKLFLYARYHTANARGLAAYADNFDSGRCRGC